MHHGKEQKLLSTFLFQIPEEYTQELRKKADTIYNDEILPKISQKKNKIDKENDEMEKWRKSLNNNAVTLQSNILQWPHHMWLPADKDLNMLKSFLLEVNPQKIIITSPPKGRTQDKDRLIKFLGDFKSKHNINLEFIFLEDSTNYKIISHNIFVKELLMV